MAEQRCDMSGRVCYVVGAGDFCVEVLPRAGDYIIAADGGYAHLSERGIVPDLVCGDFDSLGYVPQHGNIVRHPEIKDDTDMMLAVLQGLERGFEKFVINGALGGRLDHTLGNIQVLAYLAQHGARASLVGCGAHVTAVCNGEIRFPSSASGVLSVFAYGGAARGVYEENLKYTLTDFTLKPEITRGVSNEFLGEPSRISVADGTLVITWSGDFYECMEEFYA